MIWKDVDASKTHRLFYPQVPIIVTAGFQGRVGAMPAIWCMPLSFKPPLVGVAIAPEHETYKIILSSDAFGINWVDFAYAKQVGELGETSAKEFREKLSGVGFTAVQGKTGQPLIYEAEAILEYRLYGRNRFGTHELMVGEVLEASASEKFGEYWDFSKYDPLLYSGTVNRKGKRWLFKSGLGKEVAVRMKLGR